MMKVSLTARQKLQRQFWQKMRTTFAEANTQLVLGRYADYGDWMNCEVGIKQNKIRIYLDKDHRSYRVMAHLDGRKVNPAYSRQWFYHMLANRLEIEQVTGAGLDWGWEERADRVKTDLDKTGLVEVEISKKVQLGNFSDQQTWPQLICVMRQHFKDFKSAFEPYMHSFVAAHGYLQHDGSVTSNP
jgi:hypothetical protein